MSNPINFNFPQNQTIIGIISGGSSCLLCACATKQMSVLKFRSQFDEIFINWIITIFDAFHRKLIISQVSNYDRIQIININTWELGQAEREESRQKPVRMLRQGLCSVAICQTTPSVTKYGLNWRHCIVTSSHCLLSLSLSLSLSPIPRHSAISARTTQFPDWRLRL